MQINKILLYITLIFSINLEAKPNKTKIRIDEVPMYGGMDRTEYRKSRKGDKKFIDGVVKEFGTRKKASQIWIDSGFKFLFKQKLGMAMRRFNQAWLLDPENPDVYAGFGTVLYYQEKYCKSMKMLERALELNASVNQGIYADAGKSVTLCALNDDTLSKDEKNQYFDRSDKIFKKAIEIETNKEYVYSMWASALYWRGNYPESWDMIDKQRSIGGKSNKVFLELLSNKLIKPK